MKLRTYKTLWGWSGTAEEAVAAGLRDGFDGLEGQMREGWEEVFRERDYIAEIVTGDDYAPKIRMGVESHLDDLQRGLEKSLVGEPRFANVLGGCDWWSFAEKVNFAERLVEIESEFQLPLSLETHRSRMTFHPWVTRDILREVPELRLTLDFSHWCCVTERLVMDEEAEFLQLLATRCRHLHARVGYDQGPQVPDPTLKKFEGELAAHERWWRVLWEGAKSGGREEFTVTPEFGPDGYQQEDGWGRVEQPKLDELNAKMRRLFRERTLEW